MKGEWLYRSLYNICYYARGNWLLVGSDTMNSSFNFNYLDENLNMVFPYPLHYYSNDSYGDTDGYLCYDRLVIKLPVDKDANGKVTEIAATNDEDSVESERVVIDLNKNIIFVPSELGYSTVHDYYADGYTYTHKSKDEYLVINNCIINCLRQTDFILNKIV